MGLEAAEKVFGVDTNSLGYKVPRGCGVIQGDGINIEVLDDILQAVMAKGFSAQVLTAILIKLCICCLFMNSKLQLQFYVLLSGCGCFQNDRGLTSLSQFLAVALGAAIPACLC